MFANFIRIWEQIRFPIVIFLWALLLAAIAYLVFGSGIDGGKQGVGLNYAIVFAIGLMVGMTEMMARYTDAPFRPLLSFPGLLYFAINGGASILAYYMIGLMGFNPEMATTSDEKANEVLKILSASLGAMAFFRSGFFTMRLGENDVAIGPNLILQVLLQALDRAYDRDRAAPRSDLARDIMGGVSFESARNALPIICFNLMQNVTEDERELVGVEVAALDEASNMNDEARVLNLGLTLMNVVGEKALRAAVAALGPTVQGFRAIDDSMLLKLAAIPAETVVTSLPAVCNELCHASAKLEDASQLATTVVAFDLAEENKAILILYKVIRQYGPATVENALNALMP